MHKWMVAENSNGQKSFFFAVGLLHIISVEDNLPQLLREKGYTVEEVPQNTQISRTDPQPSNVEDEDDQQDYDKPQNEEKPPKEEETFEKLLKWIGKPDHFGK
ncbi:hypothetical protein niasHT_013020 [Heterodera trifolii]|uniref:Uncharacterized protein n=1 Tax=Heterodera trifolii TaxID=157864 RepID=A0ABD2L3U0_9BILA